MNKGLVKVIIGIILLGLISLPACASTLEKELQKLRDAGIPTTIEELNLPEIPDEENGALVYREVFNLIDSLYKKYRKEWDYMPYQGTVKWDKVPEEEKKKVIDLILHNPEFARMYKLLEKASRMKCQFFTKKEDYWKGTFLLNTHSFLRSCARTLAEKAKIEAENGEINKALYASLTGFKTAKSLSDEPIIIFQLCRIAMNSITLSTLEEIINKGGGNIAFYQSLMEEIEQERKSNLINYGLKGDLILLTRPEIARLKEAGKDAFELTEEEKKKMEKFYGSELPEKIIKNKKEVKEALKEIYIKSGCKTPEEFFEKQEILYLNTTSKIISLTGRPYWKAREELKRLVGEIQKLPAEKAILTQMFVPTLPQAYLQEAKLDALLGAAEIGIANRIYKIKHGKYVNSLNQLTLDILSSLPLDPFTGKDYIYKRKDKGFIVYSVGDNLKDDGGIEEKSRLKPDIVWEDKGK